MSTITFEWEAARTIVVLVVCGASMFSFGMGIACELIRKRVPSDQEYICDELQNKAGQLLFGTAIVAAFLTFLLFALKPAE